MDFDTFQNNYQNNQDLLANNFGFEFDHLKPNNNIPSLEQDSRPEFDELKRNYDQLQVNFQQISKQLDNLRLESAKHLQDV